MKKSSFRCYIILFLGCLLLLFPDNTLYAQEAEWLKEEIRLKSGTQQLSEALKQLTNFGISVSYRNDQLPDQKLTIRSKKQSVGNWLATLFDGTELTYTTVGIGKSLVIFPNPELINNAYTIHGKIYDALSGERLILANIYVKNREQGVSSNEYGQYAINIKGGRLKFDVSYVGYKKRSYDMVLGSDSLLNIALQPDYNLQQIIVTANTDSVIGVNPDAGGVRIGISETDQLSGPGGESDPVRLVSLLPGIATGADGVGGINIRGSDASQNLILLDGVPVYNLNHAGGLFSIFNSQAIRRLDLYKNGIPARYGGRLSGVLDVHTRDGNLYQNEVQLSQSLFATRFTAEGPLKAGKSAYLLSGRFFGSSLIVPSLSRQYKARRGRTGEANYDLFDFNFKLNHTIGDRDHIYLSFYNGIDDFSNNAERRKDITVLGDAITVFNYQVLQRNELGISWGNAVGALRWNHIFNDDLFCNLSLTYSDLNLKAGFLRQDSLVEVNTGVDLGSGAIGAFFSDIEQFGLAFDGQWLPRIGQEIRFGGQLNLHEFKPLIIGSNRVDDVDLANINLVAKTYSPVEVNAYMAYVARRPDMQFRAGLRMQYWSVDKSKAYLSISPRLLYTRRLSPSTTLQTTLDVTTQAVHLLGSATIGLPTDIWVPSTKSIAPSRAFQLSSSLKSDIGVNWDIGLSVYAKKMYRLVEYLNQEDLVGAWEDQVSIGKGDAYGAEFTLRRNRGPLRGWLSYTLAKTTRKFGPEVNLGNSFPHRYDRRHSVSILLSWHPSTRSALTMAWRYGTGAAYSFNLDSYNLPFATDPENPDLYFSLITQRNGFRLPPLHRLDINYRFTLANKKSAQYTHTFDIGLYNAYDRHNEIFYELRTDYDRVRDELIANRGFVKIFIAPLLPIFSYHLHFKGKRNDKFNL